MFMKKIMLALAAAALGSGWAGPALPAPGPAAAPPILRAAAAASPAIEVRCSFRRWCGPTKCHRRLWCR
jgi:hypothetical protein